MPLPDPPPMTSPRPGAIRPSRSPTAIRLRELNTRWFAQRIATHSNDRYRRRRQPAAVSKRKPRTTYTRTGTQHSQAASIPRSPAFGVDAFTIVGRSRRISRIVAQSARRSASGDGSRTKGRCSTVTPSSHLPGSGGSSGFDRRAATVTSNPASTRWPSCPRTSTLEISSVSRYSTLVRGPPAAPATAPALTESPFTRSEEFTVELVALQQVLRVEHERRVLGDQRRIELGMVDQHDHDVGRCQLLRR